jgi:TonB family protein
VSDTAWYFYKLMRFVAFLSALAAAQCDILPDATTDVAYRLEDGVSPPVLVRKVDPIYSDDGLKAKWQGTVKISLLVALDGKPEHVEVIQKLGLGLDEKALEAVSNWRFKPGAKEGRDVQVAAVVDVTFAIRFMRVTRLDFSDEPNISPPTVFLRYLPVMRRTCGEVTMMLRIDANGVPTDVRVIRGTDQSILDDAVQTAKNWRFRPAKENGVPVASGAELSLACDPLPPPGK